MSAAKFRAKDWMYLSDGVSSAVLDELGRSRADGGQDSIPNSSILNDGGSTIVTTLSEGTANEGEESSSSRGLHFGFYIRDLKE